MCYLAQINIGINPASSMGLFQIAFGLFYLIFTIVNLLRIGNRLSNSAKILYIIQLIILPVLFILSGFILLLQGWRLEPILQFQQIILSVLVFYLSLKDILVNAVNRNR